MNSMIIVRNGKEAKNFDAVKVMTDYFAEEEAVIAAMEKLKVDFATELNQQKESTESLPSGLKIFTLKEGAGDKPKIGDKVLVSYAGWLSDGSLFDSNYEEIATKFGQYDERRKQGRGYEPIPMDYSPDSRLVAGFKEGLLTMKVGDKIRLFIPPHLGYGPQGGGPIPPNADLIFDLEILGITE
jgi:FKBP-type peptidyl-prolyl cis-trans isomerase